jgi:hypothetical protein
VRAVKPAGEKLGRFGVNLTVTPTRGSGSDVPHADYTDMWALLFIERIANVSSVDSKNIFAFTS